MPDKSRLQYNQMVSAQMNNSHNDVSKKHTGNSGEHFNTWVSGDTHLRKAWMFKVLKSKDTLNLDLGNIC